MWYQPATPLTSVTPETSSTSLPLRVGAAVAGADVSDRCIAGVLALSLPPAPPATDAQPESSPPPPPSVDVPVHQQQQPRVSTAVARSASQQREGLGPQHGFGSMLAARENIAMVVSDQSPPHMPALTLPSYPSSELVTSDSYREA